MSRVKWSWFYFLTLLMALLSCLGFRVYRICLGFRAYLQLEFAADSQAATGSDSTCAGDGMGNGGSLSEAEELSQLALKLEQEAL